MNSKETVKQYRYAVLDKEMTFKNAYRFSVSHDENETGYFTLPLAEDYYEQVNDWKPDDSILVELFKEDGTSLKIFDISYEIEPNFRINHQMEEIFDDVQSIDGLIQMKIIDIDRNKIVNYQCRYFILNEEVTFEDLFFCGSNHDENDVEYLVKKTAESYYRKNFYRWEEGASIPIELLNVDGSSLGVFNVTYNLQPRFWSIPEMPVLKIIRVRN